MSAEQPAFLSRAIVDQLHSRSLELFGGMTGVRDDGLVESALASAENAWFYGGGDLFDIAAAYAFHLSQAQAFFDGNKRTAVASAADGQAGACGAVPEVVCRGFRLKAD